MIVVGMLTAILAFTVVTFGTSLVIERAYAGQYRPFVTVFSVLATGLLSAWLVQGGAADVLRSLSDGLTVRSGASVVLSGVAAGALISGV